MKKGGFTYIEILIAITVSAAIFSAVLPLMFASIAINRNARLNLLAYEAASDQIEGLRELKIPSIVTPSHIVFPVNGIPGSSGDTYLTRDLGDQNIVTVKVTVSWPFQGKNKSVSMNTYLYGSAN